MSKMAPHLIIFLVIASSAKTIEGQVPRVDQILTVAQRIEIFGTNSSVDSEKWNRWKNCGEWRCSYRGAVPPLDYISLKRVEVHGPRSDPKRPVNLERYSFTYKGERVVFTLRQNRDLLAPAMDRMRYLRPCLSRGGPRKTWSDCVKADMNTCNLDGIDPQNRTAWISGCLVHHHQRAGQTLLYPCSRGLSKCFYVGHSDTHNNSWAAVNTCRGMKGFVSIGNASLIIAPLHTKSVGNHDNESHTHVVYRYVSNKTVCDDGTGSRLHIVRRNKRATKRTKYIETRVTVDPQVHSFHGNESEEYVQTLFNMASRLFEDKSLDLEIKLCLSELHIYESYDDIGTRFTRDALRTLNNYCDWQDKNYTTFQDANVLLTRINIVYNGADSTVGLANTPGMCQKRRNCAVVEDIGPSSGVILAHELGHLFGMDHDSATACKGDPGIMGAGMTGQNAFRWTPCSRQAASSYLSTSDSDCLNNQPVGLTNSIGFNRGAPQPGTIYTRHDQCRMLVGNQATYCTPPSVDVCDLLTCRKTASESCIMYSSVIIDGTDCNNTRTWCMSGRCVPINQSVVAVDGQWGTWKEEACSRSCGGGVKIRRRICNSPPPQYGGKACVGDSVAATLCNMQPCLGDYRTEQCNDFAAAHTNGADLGLWKPTLVIGEYSCLISCESPNYTYNKIRQYHFNDGTPCELPWGVPYGRCVDGLCKKFGCDGIMDSNKVYGKCGICNGGVDECDRAFGVYNKQGPKGTFNTAVVIPRFSFSIKVRENNTYCFLGVLVNGKPAFKLGADSRVYVVDGVRIRYTKFPEGLEIAGPTQTEVQIQVYRQYDARKYQGVSPEISYEYYRRKPFQATRFHWSTQFGACSRSCGTGYKTPVLRCVDLSFGPVSDSHCDVGNKPSELRQPCKTHTCPREWRTSYLGPCSKTCGVGGTRTRRVHCVQFDNEAYTPLPDNNCDVTTKPNSTESCSDNPCPPQWRAEAWSACSATCGEGVRRRTVKCFKPDGTRVEAGRCDVTSRPVLEQACMTRYCGRLYGGLCRDRVPSCKHRYGGDICYGDYKKWAVANCARECGMCFPGDNPLCRQLANKGTNICTMRPQWGKVNCPRMCSHPDKIKDCVDQPQCPSFAPMAVDVCQTEDFALQICPKMCGKCESCEDKLDCRRYGRMVCTQTDYNRYMWQNCPRYCGFCSP